MTLFERTFQDPYEGESESGIPLWLTDFGYGRI